MAATQSAEARAMHIGCISSSCSLPNCLIHLPNVRDQAQPNVSLVDRTNMVRLDASLQSCAHTHILTYA